MKPIYKVIVCDNESKLEEELNKLQGEYCQVLVEGMTESKHSMLTVAVKCWDSYGN